MEFKKDDKVEHVSKGKGIFIKYGTIPNQSVVQFDQDSKVVTVSTNLLDKL